MATKLYDWNVKDVIAGFDGKEIGPEMAECKSKLLVMNPYKGHSESYLQIWVVTASAFAQQQSYLCDLRSVLRPCLSDSDHRHRAVNFISQASRPTFGPNGCQ